MVGAYRPEELISPPPDGRGIPRCRCRMNTWRSMAAMPSIWSRMSETEQRVFTDALLDRLPNRFAADFRAAFLHQCDGHALLAVELLQQLQARSAITLDNAGIWHAQQAPALTSLPLRVQALMSMLIDRLEPEAQETLAICSVEGEVFTAEVVALVRGIPVLDVVVLLGRILDRQYGLVRFHDVEADAPGHITRYRFRYTAMRHYLYQQLDSGEQLYLHEAVTAAAKRLYSGDDRR